MKTTASTKPLSVKGAVSYLKASHDEAVDQIDRLHALITNLRYEGKLSLGKNLKELREVLSFFNRQLRKHMELEEEVIFPFLETHVPKLESLIRLLHLEHEDFETNLENIQFQIQNVLKTSDELERGKIVEKIRERGTYLTYLLRNHIQEENGTVYKALTEELHPNEKKELERLMKRKG